MQTLDLDATDVRLLESLQGEARLSNVELSERVHLSPSQCYRRLRRLEDGGVVRAYAALLDREGLGFGVMAFVNVTLEKHGEHPAQAFHQAVQDEPEILECYAVSGEADYLLRVVAGDLKAFSDFLMHRLLRLPMVANVRSSILLDELKATTALPLRHLF
jgi:Lrp/AsnC family leucine-responsive transcriptional regulator